MSTTTEPLDVTVTREPLTYDRHAPRSYFRDLALSANGDNAARARIERHGLEMMVELERRERRAEGSLPDELGVERRANPDRTPGQGGNFAPPLWLIDQFATAPRPGRVLADMAPGFVLPQGAQSVNIPRLTTGMDSEPVADLSAPGNQDLTDAPVTAPVVTITGEGNVALQLLEQSPPGAHLDFAIFKDLSEDYDSKVEKQLLAGTGSGGQMLGITQVPTINSIIYTTASPAVTGMFPLLGECVAQIGDNRSLPPETWLLRTARWAWLASGEDSSNRPIVLTSHDGPLPYVGDLLGFPARVDDAIAVTTNQDLIVACRPSDLLLLESVPRTSVQFDVLSGTLQARLQLVAYAAGVTGRYPSGISVLTGTGMTVQTGF